MLFQSSLHVSLRGVSANLLILTMLKQKQIALLGAGRLGEALIRGLLDAQAVTRERLRATVRTVERAAFLRERYGLDATAGSNREAASGADIVIVAVKPGKVVSVLRDIRPVLRTDQTVVSLAAAVRLRLIQRELPESTPILRAMPNLGMTVGESATALCQNRAVTHTQHNLVASVFQTVGTVVFVDESAMDSVTALAGSGPAFLFYVLDALAQGGRRAGLPDDVAYLLARQTFLGAARLVTETELSARDWIEQVKTPGGTTVEGLAVLDRLGARDALIEAVEAASERSRQITAELESS